MFKRIWLGMIVIMMIMISACTHKKNPVGTSGQQGPTPIETEITTDLFAKFYSFEDSIRNYNSDILIAGNYFSNDFPNQAVTLLKFSSLVDTFYQVENVRLFLRINENYNFDVIDNISLKVGKIISADWFETTATWLAPSDSTQWFAADEFSFADGEDVEMLPDLEMELIDDSLSIFLPQLLLEDWILADSLNFGLALFTEDEDKFVEFHSAESDDENSPRLYFDYRETEEDTLITYYRTPTHDVLIYDSDDVYQIFEDKLIASNIQPIKMLTKFDIPASIFTEVDYFNTVIEDTLLYLQRLTINRAELILSYENDFPYPLEATINLDPYLVIVDSTDWNLTDPYLPLLSSDDYQDPYISSSSDSLNSAAFAVNITGIIQKIVAGEAENFGIMIRSLYENRDFRHTEFFYDENDLSNPKNPKINIIFTPPYFGE